MKIVVKEVGKNPIVRNISDDTKDGLKELQDIVGGFIETVPYDDFLLICNEEGKLQDLAPNFFYGTELIVGNVAFVGKGMEDFVSLTIAQQNHLLNKFTTARNKR